MEEKTNKKNFNFIVFIALMGTSALTLATKSIFNNIFTDLFSYLLEISVIILFLFYFLKFIFYIFDKEKFIGNLKNPSISNLHSAIPIASALISIMLIQIELPYLNKYNIYLSILFWLISLILSSIFIILIPINLKFIAKPEQVSGTWFLPPVGLFVLISAGSILALKFSYWGFYILLINFFLFGPAFILYFLTLSLVYFRSKFYELKEPNITPTFNIVLAPVGVSILAMLTTSKLLLTNDFMNLSNLFLGISKIYSLIMFGYGLWALLGLSLLYYRISKEIGPISFSELWWAFIFPIGAFTLASINLYSVTNLIFIKIFYFILYFILLFLWIYVFLNQIFKIQNLKKIKESK